MDETTVDRRNILRGGAALVAALATGEAARPAWAAPPPKDNVVIQWNNVALAAVRATIPGPTVTSRSMAIVHTAMYDAWSAFEPAAVATRPNGIPKHPGGNGLGGKIHAINYAAYRALLDLFPSQASKITAAMRSMGEDPNNNTTDTKTHAGIGNVAARAVLDFRHSDGSNQAGGYADTSGYQPVNTWDRVNDPTRWQPLKVNGNIQRFTTPHWGRVTPFALTSGSQFRPPGPITNAQSSAFRNQVDVVRGYNATLTDRTKVIADYWANGPRTEFPPGHWDLVAQYASAQFVSRRNRNDPNNDVQLFFALTNAIFDAGIACWDCKRAYDYVRPITAVRFLYANQSIPCWGGVGQGTITRSGSEWMPYQEAGVVTPPFAEYPSGHSTFSAAGAEVLKRFTGSNTFGNSYTAPPGSTVIEPGIAPSTSVTLSWATYSAAAAEAGLSRQYGGIHFEQGDRDGQALGRQCGAQAYATAQAYINGTIR
jgi:membrane-associated phospholipid phosphatase